MRKDVSSKNDLLILSVKTAVLEIATTVIFICLFSAIMYFMNLNKNLSPVLATVSIAAGSLAASFYAAKKIGNRGYATGLAVGIITFVIITLISFIVDDGAITFNTLFHLVIIMLSSLIGGILGVNKKGKSYI